MDDDFFYQDSEDVSIYNVQFVGGHSDGVELSVVGLKPEFHLRFLDQVRYEYGDWDKPVVPKREVYVLLPGTTIYVYKRTE